MSCSPVVSIILPTYNRAEFLPEAIAAIRDQQFTDWELIVVDDGSTDETPSVLATLLRDLRQPYRMIRQENQGASGARNTGIDHATGKYIAFYDSDDLWLPHHLTDCVDVLDSNPDIDWIYSATRFVDMETGETISLNFFFVNGSPRSFLSSSFRRNENLFVLPPADAARIAIDENLYCGLQTSIIRREVFASRRIPAFRVGEDQALSIVCAADGLTLACLSDVHVVYRQHASNTSSSPRKSLAANILAREELIRAFSSLLIPGVLPQHLQRPLRRRINRDLFWGVGYQLQLAGEHGLARVHYWSALAFYPWILSQWKTLCLSYPRHLLQLALTAMGSGSKLQDATS